MNRETSIARAISALIIMAAFIAYFMWPPFGFDGLPRWHYVVLGAVGLAVLILTLSVKRLSSSASNVLTGACFAVALAASAFQNMQMATTGLRFEAFLGQKLAALAVAMLAPLPRWLGFAVILVAGATPILACLVLIPEPYRRNLIPPEPWSTLTYAIFAAGIYSHRLRELQNERRMIRAQERAEMFLAVSDLANTPLQILILSSAMIRRECPHVSQHCDQIDHSVAKIMALSKKLNEANKENVPLNLSPTAL